MRLTMQEASKFAQSDFPPLLKASTKVARSAFPAEEIGCPEGGYSAKGRQMHVEREMKESVKVGEKETMFKRNIQKDATSASNPT